MPGWPLLPYWKLRAKTMSVFHALPHRTLDYADRWAGHFGARCPAESMREHELVPTYLVVAIDICLLLAILIGYLIKKHRTRRRNQAAIRRQDDGVTDDVVFGTSPSASARRSHQLARTMPNRRTNVRADNYDGCADDDSFTSEQAFASNTAMQRLIFSIRKAVTTSTVGLSFGFRDLSRTVGCDKTILEGVTGTIDRGTLFGVMGGSGAGKSTFMNVLMGKLRATAGSIEVNGREDKLSRYRKLYGYVPQDDILHPELTVRENIMHAAKVRLPAKWEQAEILDHVDAILGCLQLSHVQHSRVGDPRHPLISGGQRKRVNIGMELASAPMALFLDEPTSGNVVELVVEAETSANSHKDWTHKAQLLSCDCCTPSAGLELQRS